MIIMTVYQLLIAETIPATSEVIPLIGKYCTLHLTKAVTRIYFRGCWGTTQHSRLFYMAEARRAEEGVGFLGRTRRAPSPPAV